jgi:hypothetical protein
VRDGKKARELAERACGLGKDRYAPSFFAAALADAACGDTGKARTALRSLIAAAKSQNVPADDMVLALEMIESGRAVRFSGAAFAR